MTASYVIATIRADTDEAAEEERLLGERLASAGIQLVAATLPGCIDAAVDGATKSGFLLDVWRQSEVPVLWIDLGSDFDIATTVFGDADLGVHDHGRRHDGPAPGVLDLETSVLWFGATRPAGALLEAWAARCAAAPAADEALHLTQAYLDVLERMPVSAVWLPASAVGVRGVDALRGEELSHAGTIFGSPPHPYYIVAPPFAETSAGVFSLHALCHALNGSGYPAYIVGTDQLNPRWNTRTLSQDQADAYTRAGAEPIVVYPEVMSGNPLGAATVVRYVLNVPGFFTGESMNAGPDDLYFYYSEQFIEERDPRDVDYLMVPTIDRRMFRPDPAQVRDKVLIYQHRFPLGQIERSLFPEEAELLSMSNPLSLPDLARLFQRTKVLYSYELSGTCTMAMACGVPVIYRPEGGMTELPSTFLLGTDGAALSDEPGGLERAASTVTRAAEAIGGWEAKFWEQLAVFVRKTQQAAAGRAG